MKLEQISSELNSRMSSMSEIAHDNSLSAAEKAKQLQAMKAGTLEKIATEFSGLTVISQSILDNIRTIVEREDWAKLPPPKSLAISLATATSVTAALQSIAGKILPDMQGFQRLFLEIMSDWIKNLSDADVLGLNQQWKAADQEFEKSKAAAIQERTSGIVSGAVGIVTSAASMVAKSVVTVKASVNASKIGPGKDVTDSLKGLTEHHQATQIQHDAANKKVLDVKAEIQNQKMEIDGLRTKKAGAAGNPSEVRKINQEIKMRKAVVGDLESNQLPAAELKLAKTTEDLKLASLNLSATTAGIESANNRLGQEVQKLRAKNDIADMAMQSLQGLGKLGTSFVDFESKEKRIEADKAAFVKNFAATVQQNARKDAQDVRDAINSCMSTTSAILQALDGAASYANRTV